MLHPQLNPLPLVQQDKLLLLLASDALGTLKRVVEAKALSLACGAVNDALRADDTNLYGEKSMQDVVSARRYRIFLEVLKEIETDKTHSTITINTTP